MKLSEEEIKKLAADPKPQPEIPVPLGPWFAPKRFNSYEEYNKWKDERVKIMESLLAKSKE